MAQAIIYFLTERFAPSQEAVMSVDKTALDSNQSVREGIPVHWRADEELYSSRLREYFGRHIESAKIECHSVTSVYNGMIRRFVRPGQRLPPARILKALLGWTNTVGDRDGNWLTLCYLTEVVY